MGGLNDCIWNLYKNLWMEMNSAFAIGDLSTICYSGKTFSQIVLQVKSVQSIFKYFMTTDCK